MSWQDVLAILGTLPDLLCGAVLCIVLGYRLLPSALGLLVGGFGSLLAGSPSALYYQQEGMTQANNLVKDTDPKQKENARSTMILGAAFLTGLIGAFRLPQLIVDTVGAEIFSAMLAGVGVFLVVMVALWELNFKNWKNGDWKVGLPTIAVALATYFHFQTTDPNNALIWTIAISVFFGLIFQMLLVWAGWAKYEKPVAQTESWIAAVKREFRPIHPVLNRQVVIGMLALSTLTIGGNLAYGYVNASMTQGVDPHYNALTVVSALADWFTSLFGGPSIETVVAGTAAAPNPVLASAILVILGAVLIFSGVGGKIARRVPPAAMSGYLVVIGGPLVMLPNAQEALKAGTIGNLIVVTITAAVTLRFNPFWGLLTGVVLKLALGLVGVH